MGEQVAARVLNESKPKAQLEFSTRRAATLSEGKPEGAARG